MNRRDRGVEYFVKAVRSGEPTAVERLSPYLAPDVQFEIPSELGRGPSDAVEVYTGPEEVKRRLNGQWPVTYVSGRLGWSEPVADGAGLKVTTSGPVTVSFEFNEADEIHRVRLDGLVIWGPPAEPQPSGEVDEIPLVIRGLINNSRSNNNPLAVCYVDGDGAPHTSYRGATFVISPTQISLWIRAAGGGLAEAVATNPHVSLIYGDLEQETLIMVGGLAAVANDEETRRRAYENSIEAEQKHDAERAGVAVVVDVTRLEAWHEGRIYIINRTP